MEKTLEAVKISVPADMLDGNVNDYFALRIKGDTYYPFYMDGDTVLFCRDLSKDNPSGVYLVEINEQLELRNIETHGEENNMCLCGISPSVPPLYLSHEEYSVIGFPSIVIRKL